MRYASFQCKVLLVLLECGVLLLLTGFESFDHLLRIQLLVRLFLTGLKSFDHLLRMRSLVLLSRTGLKSFDHLSSITKPLRLQLRYRAWRMGTSTAENAFRVHVL